ncbi:MAG: biopolymer transporter ExbD [Alphaproteobacteria bacterium]|nr:biopolymer transporter ExbD [Alphaproteobacteria bacterium]
MMHNALPNIGRTGKVKREISIVPLINVVFLLLIFFLVAGTIQKIEIVPIDPPMAESGKILDEGHIVIVLGRYDEIIIDDQLVQLTDIVPILKEALKDYPGKIITIKSDAQIHANSLIAVMDEVKAAGGQNVSLVTQSPL